TRLDHRHLRAIDPATFSDGTPSPPALLARLACGSQLSRIIFGPDSTVLDVGRTKRIFPANQVKAVIARDRHCQYPGCHEPPEFGEIHHSLWWAKHNGPTAVSHGILRLTPFGGHPDRQVEPGRRGCPHGCQEEELHPGVPS